MIKACIRGKNNRTIIEPDHALYPYTALYLVRYKLIFYTMHCVGRNIILVQSFIGSTPYIIIIIEKEFIQVAVEMAAVFQQRDFMYPYFKFFIKHPEPRGIR